MGSFFKSCGKGILMVVLSPIWLLIYALFIIYGIVLFFVQLVKSVCMFFAGKSYTLKNMSVDKKARSILEGRGNVSSAYQQPINIAPTSLGLTPPMSAQQIKMAQMQLQQQMYEQQLESLRANTDNSEEKL